MRYAALSAVLSLLVGCPAALYSHLHNGSDSDVSYVYTAGYNEDIDAGRTKKVAWHPICVKLSVDGETIEYPSRRPADSTIKVQMFSTSFHATIDDQLEIVLPDGQRLAPGECK